MTSAQQIGGATGRGHDLDRRPSRMTDALAAGAPPPVALTDGFSAAFQIEAIILLGATSGAVELIASFGPHGERLHLHASPVCVAH